MMFCQRLATDIDELLREIISGNHFQLILFDNNLIVVVNNTYQNNYRYFTPGERSWNIIYINQEQIHKLKRISDSRKIFYLYVQWILIQRMPYGQIFRHILRIIFFLCVLLAFPLFWVLLYFALFCVLLYLALFCVLLPL